MCRKPGAGSQTRASMFDQALQPVAQQPDPQPVAQPPVGQQTAQQTVAQPPDAQPPVAQPPDAQPSQPVQQTAQGAELTPEQYKAWMATQSDTVAARETAIHVYKMLHKVKQLEKAVFFLERRSDSLASLPHELDRHYAAAVQRGAEAWGKRDQAAWDRAQADWQSQYRNAIWQACMGGCLPGIMRLLTLNRSIGRRP